MRKANIRVFLYKLWTFFTFLATLILITFFLVTPDPDKIAHRICHTCYPNSSPKSKVFLRNKQCLIESLDLHLPIFYFEFNTLATPSSFSQTYPASKKTALGWLIRNYGNWPYIQIYYQSLDSLRERYPTPLVTRLYDNPWNAEKYFQLLLNTDTLSKDGSLWVKSAFTDYQNLKANTTRWKVYIPKIIFHGRDNQFHLWIVGLILEGKKGVSQLEISCRYCNCSYPNPKAEDSFYILKPCLITFVLALGGIIGIFSLSIPLGIFSVYFKKSILGSIVPGALILLDAIPTFLIAFVFYYMLKIRDYQTRNSFGEELLIADNRWLLLLVMSIYVLVFIAPVTQIIIHNLDEERGKPYYQTALAKGNSEWRALIFHALPNILFPLITVGVGIFTGLISGAVILETIFDIPGLGTFTFNAARNNDVHPLLVSVAIIGSWGYVGTWLIDTLYQIVDPRIGKNR